MMDNVFITDNWAQTLEQAYGFKRGLLDCGTSHLPYMIDRRCGINNYFSMPLDTYGGPIGYGKDFVDLTRRFYDLPGFGYRYIVAYDQQVVDRRFGVSKRSCEILHLTDKGYLWKKMHKDNRTSIRAASAHQTTMEIGNHNAAKRLLTSHVDGHEDIPERLLDAMRDCMGDYYVPMVAWSGDMHITPSAASVFFLYGDTMMYWANMVSPIGRQTKANYALLWTAILYALNSGCTMFNFGASPEGAAYLVKFKRSWGTISYDYNVYYRIPMLMRPIMKVRDLCKRYY